MSQRSQPDVDELTQGDLFLMLRNGRRREVIHYLSDHEGAVDLRDLVGYEVEEGGTDRRLQSSLGAFG